MRTYNVAQTSQAEIALAMRQVSEVTWRVKSLEMWTRLTLKEAQHANDRKEPSSLIRSKAFALGDARALNSLRYLDQVLDPATVAVSSDVLKILEQVQDPLMTSTQSAELLEGSLQEISILVKEAGNLNFESVANLMTDNKRSLIQNFSIAIAVAIVSLTIALALWRTERSLRERLLQSDKTQLETLGALSSGFAHLTQNTLWSLRESLDALKDLQTIPAKDREGIGRALGDIRSLNALNKALTKAAHDPSKDDEDRPLTEIIEQVGEIFEGPEKRVSLSLDPSIENTRLPFATTVFVLSELINNALDATQSTPDGHINLTVRKDRRSIAILVEDNGSGMSSSVSENCLQPFFTTKPETSGHCGFGLHSVARLISGLDGQIRMHSKKDVGTTVSILLPRGT